jgi:hypothetical protein
MPHATCRNQRYSMSQRKCVPSEVFWAREFLIRRVGNVAVDWTIDWSLIRERFYRDVHGQQRFWVKKYLYLLTHTYARKNIQKCNCLFRHNAAACKAENGKLENLSYVTKIEQMMGFWRAIDLNWRFASNAPLATCWQNNLHLHLDLWKQKKGSWLLGHGQPNGAVVPTAEITWLNNLTTLMLPNMRLTIMI